MTKTVLVSGATGAVGSAAAARLIRVLGQGDRVVLLGRDVNRLAATVAACTDGQPGPTVETALLDLKDDPRAALGATLIEGDLAVLINAVGPSSVSTIPLARAALSLGLHVVDAHGSERIIAELDGAARRAGRSVLLGAGVQPGLTGAMLTAALRLVADPSRARVEIAVGGRQPLTTATLREYIDSLSADGGWPGAVWRDGAVVKGEACGPSAAGWRPPNGASLSVHLDEEYVDAARMAGVAYLRGINVMDAPETVRELRRLIAGEATAEDVAAASRRESELERYFRIAVRIRAGHETVTADYQCADSYRATGNFAAEAALRLFAEAQQGARWAYASGAAWTGDVTFTYDLDSRGAVVVGAGFGARYAEALAGPDSPAPLTAIVGTGGRTGQALARDLGVRYFAVGDTTEVPSLPGFPRDTAVAVIAVRSGVVGGQGDALAAGFLRAGIPVLQELPVDPGTVAALTSLAREHDTTYRVTGFYEHLGSVRAFIDAVRSLILRSTVTHVLLRTSHQVLDRAALLLAEAVGAVPLGDARIAPGAAPGRWLISGMWGRVPVDILLDHRMDPRDPDNHSQPVAAAVVETADGELTWDGVGTLPRWSQRPHIAGGALTDPNGAVAQEWGRGPVPPTWGELVETAWPEGIRRAVAGLLDAGAGESRRTVFVLRWWLRVSSALPAPVDIRSTPPVRMDPPQEAH
ncbi:Saccharopine dehydrogenase [Corynebacterium oculi]|uniref:Saccharopine dehydrogenase n=1 Tax=Corynebacterium oculi TaxID=1544416 RepID=A0A0Q1DTV4_9CORY|nr:Saccharopine dehydrogenase [Corynebacterium oculi]